MSRYFLVLLAVLVPAAASGLPADLAQAAHEFDRAQMAADGRALERLLAEDYVLVNSRGLVENKAQFVADYTEPGFHLDPYVVREPLETVWSDGAVLGGLVTLSGTDGGKPFRVELRFADIWAKRNGHWQVVYTSAVKSQTKP